MFAINDNSVTFTSFFRALSSVGSEHLVYTEGVGGSNPSAPTKSNWNDILQSSLMVEIFSFKNADFHDVKSLLIGAFSKNFNKGYNADFLDCASSNGFVVKFEKKVIGYASIHIIEKVNRRSCLIEDVVISKEYRGKGVGKILINHIIDFSKKKSVRLVN